MTTYHIRINVRRPSRRIAGDRGCAGRTLCGGAMTEYDATLRDARRIVRVGWHAPTLTRCEACFQRLLAMDFKRSEGVED